MSDPKDLDGETPRGAQDQPRPHRSGGGPRWLLVLSLALNLFVLAWVGAAALHWTGVLGANGWGGHHGGFGRHAAHWYEMREGREMRGPGAAIGPLGLFLDDRPPDDPALAALYARHAPAMREAFLAARDARARVRALLRESVDGGRVDAAALEDALGDVRRATETVQSHMHAALMDAAESLDPASFAALIERSRGWREDWRSRWRDG